MKFSANLGLLWTDIELPDAIRAAARAGFDAVELHWPYETDAKSARATLDEVGLPVISLNTARGDISAGDMGLSALPGREAEARAAIDQALSYATAVGASAIHVLAGKAHGTAARRCFGRNLRYACDQAAPGEIRVLIEPLNARDVPGYFLADTAMAADIISEVAAPNLWLMFDCYHVAMTEGDVLSRLQEVLPLVGHIQFAAAPDRGPPGTGQSDLRPVFDYLSNVGWAAPLGAEYLPVGATNASLGWLQHYR